MRSLVWFTRDLRIHDHPALNAASHAQQMLCVYVVDPRWFQPRQWQTKAMGVARWRFLWQSLLTLDKQLRERHQRLHIAFGIPEQEITRLCEHHGTTHVYAGQPITADELVRWQGCKDALPEVAFIDVTTTTLLNDMTHMLASPNLPEQFGQYLPQVLSSEMASRQPITVSADLILPPAPGVHDDDRGQCPPVVAPSGPSIEGGERAALAALDQWQVNAPGSESPWQPLPLSPWIALGCLSVRQVMQRAEAQQGSDAEDANENSTHGALWLREFFQWHARRHWSSMHRRGGIDDKSPMGTFYPHRFKAWCEGETDDPLVNAAMHALQQCGQLSLFSRLAIADYFVTTLQLDWRYGLAWVQHHALDFDDAVDTFIWQVAAGLTHIGRDVLKQLPSGKTYDDHAQAFIDQWHGKVKQPMAMHVVDAADWPL